MTVVQFGVVADGALQFAGAIDFATSGFSGGLSHKTGPGFISLTAWIQAPRIATTGTVQIRPAEIKSNYLNAVTQNPKTTTAIS